MKKGIKIAPIVVMHAYEGSSPYQSEHVKFVGLVSAKGDWNLNIVVDELAFREVFSGCVFNKGE